MKKKVIAGLLGTAMVASLLAGCGSSNNTTDTTADTTAATEAAGGDYADKKVGVCIYQFSDNFMTLFRTELENYLVEQGFSKDNITIVDGANDQATQTGQIDNFISEGVDVLIVFPSLLFLCIRLTVDVYERDICCYNLVCDGSCG